MGKYGLLAGWLEINDIRSNYNYSRDDEKTAQLGINPDLAFQVSRYPVSP